MSTLPHFFVTITSYIVSFSNNFSETSYWINFFTTAGIPAGDSAHYAIMFSDNRITKEMLLDLSKEYLTDMGISRLGDIIAILKHAKHIYNQVIFLCFMRFVFVAETISAATQRPIQL